MPQVERYVFIPFPSETQANVISSEVVTGKGMTRSWATVLEQRSYVYYQGQIIKSDPNSGAQEKAWRQL